MEITFRVFWTETENNHLTGIYDYHVFKVNLKVAHTITQKLIDSTIILEKNPLSGRKEELLIERVQDFLFLVVKNYKILYWAEPERNIVYVSGIFDTRRSPELIRRQNSKIG